MQKLTRMSRNYLILLSLALVSLILYVNYTLKPLNQTISNHVHNTQDGIYSKWPEFSIGKGGPQHNCHDNGLRKSFFKLLKELISVPKRRECIDLSLKIRNLFEIELKSSNLDLPDAFKPKVKDWLGNNDVLFDQVYAQELYSIYNKYTFEENIFNPLRGKRPVKQSTINPDEYYNRSIAETKDSCDFCNYKNSTAINEFGPLVTQNAILVSNTFSFNKYHSMILSKKHNLLEITLKEFKDLFNLAQEWFMRVHRSNFTYRFPTILWDFMPKSGASQVHPHLHATMGDKKYFGLFEVLRTGAEKYFREMKANYFNDFAYIHTELGLSLRHRDALLIIPLTPKKEYDVTILSRDLSDGAVELLYGALMSLIKNLKIYPFSLIVYLPEMSDEALGKIPLYIKILPRGDVSDVRAQFSSLELLSVFNANADQYEVYKFFKTSIDKFTTISN